MADVRAAHADVVAWIRDVPSNPASLHPIPGVGQDELRQLARLAALIRAVLGDSGPAELMKALAPDAPIEPSLGAISALGVLVAEDAVVNLADLYAAIVRPAHRRPLGTFFTPRDSAQAIVRGYASRHKAPAEVVDVGAGVGIFSEIAREQWPDAAIHAVDINPLTLGLQAVATAGRPEWDVQMELMDYRLWLASSTPTRATLYLGNPPYTRWQLLEASTREELLKAAGGLVGGRANLSTLFLAMTLSKLRPEDSLAMIIPAGWMRADYGKKLRAHLREVGHRRVSLRLADSWRFHQAIVDAVLVEVGPEAGSSQAIEVSDWSGSERVTVERSDGEAAFPAPGRTYAALKVAGSASVPMSSYARITRGTASGANRFFVQAPSEWDRLSIPRKYRRRLARRLRPGQRGVPALEVSELLVLEGYERGSDPYVDAWIEQAEAAGIDSLHLCSKRPVWFDLSHEVKVPDAMISALARETFHVLPNPDGLAITNNLFGLYWEDGVTKRDKARVVAWLRSPEGQARLRATSSVEANGLHRLSPKTVCSIEIPNPEHEATALVGLAKAPTKGRRRT